ncbi:MAG: relaxase/mobilization nuclease domain-containing protein [Flavobacteriales bacterium]|nr:relaxase/mobilization nuclease domain-containing protein [Flavobacteriales bacterium]
MTIVKLLSRKNIGGAGQLIQYIHQEKEDHPWRIAWNVPEEASFEELAELFKETERMRKYQHKDAVRVSHEILSWSSEDRQLTEEMMYDLTLKYLQMRSPLGLAVAIPHLNTDAAHVHIALNGVDLQGNSIRLSFNELTELKLQLQEYQQEHYPELISYAKHGQAKEAQLALNNAEYEIKKRRGLCRREIVQKQILPYVQSSLSKQVFYQHLQELGFETYQRGKSEGIVDPENGRRYRFSRLGIELKTLEQNHERQNELDQIRLGRDNDSLELLRS